MRKNDGLENYLQKSGRFCLTRGSAGVGLHFREAPRWSRRVHMYALYMDSVDIYHGLSGQSGQCPWILWTKSSESMDKVQWDQPDWTISMDSVDTVHGLSWHCPWTQWTLSMDSVDSLDTIHGHFGQSPGSPGGLDNVHGQCPLSPWTDWTLSMDSLDKVQSDLV